MISGRRPRHPQAVPGKATGRSPATADLCMRPGQGTPASAQLLPMQRPTPGLAAAAQARGL
eukprot:9538619-Heterocapsa_arctica.AAC.1